MGVDTKLYLPPEARIEDFVYVLTGLIGEPMFLNETRSRFTSDHVLRVGKPQVQRLEVRATHVPEYHVIHGRIGAADVYVHWFYEDSSSPIPGGRLVTSGCRAGRRPVWEGLADFFGGLLDFNDSDNIAVDYVGTLYDKAYQLHAADGVGWDALQRAIAAVTPAIKETSEWNT